MGWNMKRNTVNPSWRPICTQSKSNEVTELENMANIEQGEHGNCVVYVAGEVADSTFSSSLDTENVVSVVEAVQDTPSSASTKSFGVADAGKLSVAIEKGLEEEMGVKLIFPSSEKEDSIVIEGDSMDLITKASEKIHSIIDEGVRSPALTYSHFISLPLAIHAELVDKITKFQSSVLAYSDFKDADGTMVVDLKDETSEDEEKSDKSVKAPDDAVKLKDEDTNNVKRDVKDIPLVSYAPKNSGLGIDKSLFIKPKTFHLTVIMLKLWNKGRVNAAKEVLQSVSSELLEVLDNRPLFVRLKGLDCLRGSRSKAQVLYAPVEEIGNEGRLLRACQIIRDAYVKAGLVLQKDAKQAVKLHATVMNTTHRRVPNKKRGWKDSFDATAIFEQFGSEPWGDYHIREAHLSQRFLYDENGYYHCCASIPFPEISEVPVTNDTPVESVGVSTAERA